MLNRKNRKSPMCHVTIFLNDIYKQKCGGIHNKLLTMVSSLENGTIENFHFLSYVFPCFSCLQRARITFVVIKKSKKLFGKKAFAAKSNNLKMTKFLKSNSFRNFPSKRKDSWRQIH